VESVDLYFFMDCYFEFQGPGIYHGSLNLEVSTEDHIDAAQLLPYPSFGASSSEIPEAPLSLSLTEFHFILLYKNRIVGICNLDDKITYEETLPIVSIMKLSIHCFEYIVES